jgi:predicted 3-demethylubiquinone-9 3-methyltransferase (glyoxalase superfamily)
MQKITPFLWFDNQAEEAVIFYTSVFKNSKVGNMARYDEAAAAAAGRPKGSVVTAAFELEGQEFIALNGGPHFKFSEAISFVISCDTQKEIDYYWDKLTSNGGEESQCGWLKDKFGLSWQIVPSSLSKYIAGPDKEKSKRAMGALMKMRKLVIADLENA